MKQLNIKTMVSLIVIGILAGITGIVLTLFLHAIQHYAFGYGFFGEVSFREVVEYAPPMRRLIVLLGCGGLVGIGWTCIHRYCSPLVEIKASVNNPLKVMPFKTTICHALLQIITVGMGSPLGRETAPREISAAFATKWMQVTHLDKNLETRKLLLACASGAGLAAVYNVPLASSLFILETLMVDWSFGSVEAALICCSTAVYVVRQGLGDLVQYPLPQTGFNEMLVIWAVVVGPIVALFVYLFNKSNTLLPFFNKKSPKMIMVALLSFGVIGLLSMWFPEILGNGKAGNQLSFTFSIGWQLGIMLLGTKWLAVLLAAVAGAYGGKITPSMMLGGMLALVMAVFWNLLFPVIPITVAAFVGATVFLGLAQKMPITSTVFLLELSRFSPAYLFPLCACLATALPAFNYLQNRK